MGARPQDRCTAGESGSGSAAVDPAAHGRRWSRSAIPYWVAAPGLFAALALVVFGLPRPAPAQTFSEASLAALLDVCGLSPTPANVTRGPKLQSLCDQNQNVPSGQVSAAPATGQAAAEVGPAIERRLQAVRESKERPLELGSVEAIPASYPVDLAANNGELQLPPAGGARPEIVVSPAPGLSVFASAGAVALRHHNNSFEDGYDAVLPTVTIGTDYWFMPQRLLGGAAFNYTRSDGAYDDGGSFNKDIFSPVLYATFLPFDCATPPGGPRSPCAFVNAVLSYSRNENSNDRKFAFSTEVVAGQPGLLVGHTSADYPENVYSAAIQVGYDHPIGDFTIGPRAGFSFGYSQIDSFKEHGNTGDELRYSGLDQTSVQSSLGAAATVEIAIPGIPGGKLWPQLSAAWVHEYANDARNIDASFVDASPSPTFTFQREKPARNWANIGLGVSACFEEKQSDRAADTVPCKLQPYAQFVTVQGNENFVSYGGTIGLRYSF